MKMLRPILPLLFFFLLPLMLFWPVLWGEATLIPFDNLYQGQPWAAYRAEMAVGEPHNELVSDLVLQNYHWKQFAVSQYLAGELPLWQPMQLAGSPFLALGQHSMLYPLSLLFLVLPIHVAFGWFTVISLALAGMTMYFFGRVLGLRQSGAMLAGLVYQGSGFLTISVVFPMIIAGAVWLPLLLAALHRLAALARKKPNVSASIAWITVGAIAIGLAALAGHVEILYYTLLVGGLYALSLLLRLIRKRAGISAAPTVRFVVSGGMMLIIGLLLGAAQLVPLYESVSQNFREGSATLEEVVGYAWPIRQASSFIVPDLLGNPSRHEFYNLVAGEWQPIVTQQPIDAAGNTSSLDHLAWFKGSGDWKNYVEGAGYLGILPLLLVLIALWEGWRQRSREQGLREIKGLGRGEQGLREIKGLGREEQGLREIKGFIGTRVLFFALLCLLSVLFIFGTPLYGFLFYGLPGWSQLHTPFRWIFPLTISISVLAGIGWQVLEGQRIEGGLGSRNSPLEPWERGARGVRGLGWLTLGSGVGGLLILATIWIAPAPWIGQAAKLLDRSQLTQWAFGGSATLFLSYQWANFLHLGLALLAAGIIILLALHPSPFLPMRALSVRPPFLPMRALSVRPPFLPILALSFLLLDLTAAAYGFMPTTPIEVADFTPPSIEWLTEHHQAGAWRYTALEKEWKVLNANSGMQYGLEDVRGYDSIILKHYVSFMRAVSPQPQLDFNRIAPLRSEAESLPDQELLDLLNIRYLVTDQVLRWPSWTLVYEDEVRIYENDDVLPRAFLLGNGTYWGLRSQEIPPETLQALNPRQELYLQGDEGNMLAGDALHSEMPFTPVDMTLYTPNEIKMTIAPPTGTWLALSDVDHLGWRAFSLPEGAENERELPVMRANGAFRAVWVEAGEQTIRWRYAANSVRSGFFASFLGVALLGLGAAYWAWGYVYQEQENEGTIRRVAKNSFAPMGLQLFNKAVDTVFAAFMARLLGPESLGQYAFAIALIWYFIIFSNFGLGTLLTRDVARDYQATNRLFNTTLFLRIALYMIAFPLLLLLLWFWPSGLGTLEPETSWAILLLAIGLIPSNISDAITAVFRAYEKFEIPALISTISTFIKVSIGAGLLLAGYGIVGLAATSIITNIVTLIILSLLMVRTIYRPTLAIERLSWRQMLHEALPLMINEFLAVAFFRIDQLMLKPMRNNAEAGYYNVSYKFIDGLLILPSSITLALFPVMSRYANATEGKNSLLRATVLSLRWMIIISLPLALLTTRYAETIVWLFGGPEYLPESGLALQILIWFLPFSFINSLLQYVLIAANLQQRITRAFMTALLFNLIANFFAIQYFGLYGAAAVTIFSEIALLFPFYHIMQESVGALPWLSLFSKPLIALALATLPLFAFSFPFWAAIPASIVLYTSTLLLLRTFGEEERQLLAKLLPVRRK